MPTTNVEQDNVTLVQRGFEAFSKADMPTLTELFAEDATWHAVPTGILGGDRSGRNDIFAMFGILGQQTQGSFKVVPSAFAGSGDNVFVHARATGTRNGKTIDSDEVLIFTLADGHVRDVRLFVHDQAANAAFWS